MTLQAMDRVLLLMAGLFFELKLCKKRSFPFVSWHSIWKVGWTSVKI